MILNYLLRNFFFFHDDKPRIDTLNFHYKTECWFTPAKTRLCSCHESWTEQQRVSFASLASVHCHSTAHKITNMGIKSGNNDDFELLVKEFLFFYDDKPRIDTLNFHYETMCLFTPAKTRLCSSHESWTEQYKGRIFSRTSIFVLEYKYLELL